MLTIKFSTLSSSTGPSSSSEGNTISSAGSNSIEETKIKKRWFSIYHGFVKELSFFIFHLLTVGVSVN